MITVVISDMDGNELSRDKFGVADVQPFVKLVETFGFLSDNGDEYKFNRAYVMSESLVYIDVEIQ